MLSIYYNSFYYIIIAINSIKIAYTIIAIYYIIIAYTIRARQKRVRNNEWIPNRHKMNSYLMKIPKQNSLWF